MLKKDPASSPEHRFIARVILAATRPEEKDMDISVRDLIALREGHLAGEAREELLTKLNACPDCYRQWLDLNRFLDEEQEKPQVPGKPARWKWRLRASWGLAGVASIAAAILALVILMPLRPSPDLAKRIDLAYVNIQSNMGTDISGPDTKMQTSPKTGYGFAGNRRPIPAKQSFQSGVLWGRLRLRGEEPELLPAELRPAEIPLSSPDTDPWLTTEWATFDLAGRWLTLLDAVCAQSNPPPDGFWSEQHGLSAELRMSFEERARTASAAKLLARTLERVDEDLAKLAHQQERTSACHNIRSEVAFVSQAFGETPP
jgi:hypothetical protein